MSFFPSLRPKVYTVSQVNAYLRGLMEQDLILQSLWMRGEISNWKRHSSGHCYFTLKDEDSAMNAILFRSDARILPFAPENGMNVLVCGYVGLYEKTGQYQFYVQLMEPEGIGALGMAIAQRKEKLEKEGLFDPDYKRPLPPYAKTIALVTSPTGAVVRDMIQVSRRRNPAVRIVVVPCQVQGEGAAASIVQAIKLVNAWGGADVILLGRGGGSMEDLMPFNEESVARAIFASRIPVVSCVGHETDVTISDLVADLRAPTPSAAAELAVFQREEEKRRLFSFWDRIDLAMKNRLAEEHLRLTTLARRPAFRHPKERIAQEQKELFDQAEKLQKAMIWRLEKEKARLAHAAEQLHLLSPLTQFRRGYWMVTTSEGKVLSEMAQVQEGADVVLHGAGGQARARIEKKELSHGQEETNL